jgi:hypothetical protein
MHQMITHKKRKRLYLIHFPDFFLLGLYYGVTISLVSFATGLSVVTLNIHHR